MSPTLIALLVFLAVGVGSSLLLRRQRPAADGLAQGLDYLAGLRWRELARLVILAMQARGYSVASDGHGGDAMPADGADILLERDGALTLLSCKYGSAAVVGAAAILGLSKSAQLRGANAVVVVTPGRFDDEARRLASGQHLELVDGAGLWREVQPFLPAGALQGRPPASPAPLPRLVPWLGALAVAAVAWMLLQGRGAADAPPPQAVAQVSAPAAAATVPAAPANKPAPQAPLDAPTLELRRKETADAISTLPGIDRAIWSTQSTLLVYLEGDAVDPMATLCPLLARTPELAASRLQLQPPAGSTKPVRFKQCQAY